MWKYYIEEEREPINVRLARYVARFGKLGFVARGIIYFVIGAIACAAIWTADQTQGVPGAMEVLADSTLGTVVLVALTIGIFAYALWRLFEGIAGLQIASDAKLLWRILLRFPPILSSIIYMVYGAAQIIALDVSTTSSISFTALLLDDTFGKVVLTIAGIAFIGIGGYQGYYGGTNRFKIDLNYSRMTPKMKKFVFMIGRIGIIGRGFVFLLLSVFMFRIVFDGESDSNLGLGGALGQFQDTNWGKFILILASLSLCVFGTFSMFQAKFKKFKRTNEELLLA